jgi:Xaa-Pro aminopeptidase
MRKSNVLKKSISKLGINGFLVTDLKNVRYLSGFTGSSGFLLISKSRNVFVTDFRYQEQAKQEVKGFTIKVQDRDMPDFLKGLVKQYKIRRLGFESQHMSYNNYQKLLRKGFTLKAFSDTVETLRLVKSREELTYIKTAVRRAENAFNRLQRFIKSGVREQQLAVRFEGLLREEGCKNLPFGVIVASGHMSALPHAQPSNKTIKRGDLLLFDWGGECEGYYSDMTRMVALRGKNLKKQMELYSVVSNAQKRAIKTVRSGIKSLKVDAAARDFITEKGYGKYFGHGTGHGVGLAVHERPVISWQNRETLKEGMVFTIEPGIYIPNFGGVRVEDTVTVNKNGADVLTTLPKTLRVIQG